MATVQTTSGIGFQGAVGVAVEATFNTAVSATLWLPATECAIEAKNKLISRSPIRKSKGRASAGDGQVEVSGPLTIEASPSALGTMLGLAMGADNKTGTGPYSHTFTLASPLNTATYQVDLGKSVTHQYTGCKIDSMDLSCKSASVLEAKLGIIGVTDAPINAATSPTFASAVDEPYAFEHITSCTVNGVALQLDSFQISLKNQIKPFYKAGSGRFVSSMNETEAQVSGSLSIMYMDEQVFNALYGNAAGATSNGGPQTDATGFIPGVPVVITFDHPTSPYTMTITLANCKFTDAPVTLKKSDVLMHQVKFEAFESTFGASDDLKIALVDNTATKYVS